MAMCGRYRTGGDEMCMKRIRFEEPLRNMIERTMVTNKQIQYLSCISSNQLITTTELRVSFTSIRLKNSFDS
jgi:hypothetical protein